MSHLLLQLPFHILPEAVLICALIMMARNRRQIGVRRFRFGLAGLSTLLVLRLAGIAFEVFRFSRYFDDIGPASNFFVAYGLISSILTALAFWFIFIAITNRRKVPNAPGS